MDVDMIYVPARYSGRMMLTTFNEVRDTVLAEYPSTNGIALSPAVCVRQESAVDALLLILSVPSWSQYLPCLRAESDAQAISE
jgi:hypothetical protein